MLSTAQKPKIYVDVVQKLVDMLHDQRYEPGTRLPSERTLAERLGVSRTSIRDALSRLQTMGMLESRAGLGTFVKEPTSGLLQASLVPHILTDPAKHQKVFEVREIIEVEAALRAAERATDAHLEAMRHWAAQVEISIDRNDSVGRSVADVAFHRQIVIATGNEVLVDLIDSMAGLLRDMRAHALSLPGSGPEVIAGHRAIVAAIGAHDSQAARQAMQNHLNSVRVRLKAYFGT
jgi:GntR family transcriptional regulator, transcriptional repressor for pyruvate dehydrogenase complex